MQKWAFLVPVSWLESTTVKLPRTMLPVLPMLLLLLVGAGGCRTTRPPPGAKPVQRAMLVTAYCSCRECCGWKRDWLLRPVVSAGPNAGKRKAVGRTASGAPVRSGTIAADAALFPFGTVMYVPDYGYGRVEDRGGGIKGYHIDLYFPYHRSAIRWGVRKNVSVRIWYPPGYEAPELKSKTPIR
jgi:3D (Asp-Asp-Asp) domain-containing protein